MSLKRWYKAGLGALAVMAIMQPAAVLACATCFGESDSPLAHGMNAAIYTLLGVVLLIWAGIGAFVVHLVRRSARTPEPKVASSSAREVPETATNIYS